MDAHGGCHLPWVAMFTQGLNELNVLFQIIKKYFAINFNISQHFQGSMHITRIDDQ